MQINLKDKANENRYSIYAFLIVSLVWILMYAFNHIFPFGNDVFLNSDFRDQYLPFIKSLKNIVYNRESIFFTWNMSSGQDFFANICYYMSSPLNLLVLLTPNNYEIVFLNYLTIFRMGLMAFTCSLFIRKIFNINNFSNTIFSCIYPLCGFMSIYATNIIWHDSLWIYPLVLMHLIKMLKTGQKTKYIFWLFLMILSNFYISFIMCISIFFLFIAINDWKSENNIRNLKNFIISSLISGSMCAITILPSIYIILNNESTLYVPLLSFFNNYIDIFEAFFIHTNHIYFTTNYEYAPLFCTLSLLSIVPHFFTSTTISKKEKILSFTGIVILLFSTNFALFNYILHGFHMPIGIPNRFIFLLDLLLIFIGIRSFNSNENKLTTILIYLTFISIFIFITDLSIYIKLLNIIILFIYNLLIFFNFKKTYLMLTLFETLIMALLFLCPLHNQEIDDINNASNILNEFEVETYEQISCLSTQMANIGYYNEFPSYDGFTSMLNPTHKNLSKLGLGLDDNRILSIGFTPITAELFGIKYFYYPRYQRQNYSELETILDEYVLEAEQILLYKNKSNASKSHIFNENILDVQLTENVHENFNALSNSFINKENLYTKKDIVFDIIDYKMELADRNKNISLSPKLIYEYHINIEENKDYSIIPKVKTSSLEIKGPPKFNNYIKTVLNAYYYNLSEFSTRDFDQKTFSFWNKDILPNINLKATYFLDSPSTKLANVDENIKNPFIIYEKNNEIEKELLKAINSTSVYDIEFKNNRVLVPNVKNDGILTISTLHSPGWEVYVNGEKAELLKVMDLFIGVKVNAGDNVEFKYVTPYFYIGLTISLFSLFAFVLVLQKEKIINLKILEELFNKFSSKKAD